MRADWHGQLAAILERNHSADPATLAHHYEAAGQSPRAGQWFAVAADEAAQLLAFDRAVTMYQLALVRLSPPESRSRDLTRKLADVLANAGRGAEAGRQYLAAAEDVPAELAVVFRRHAATQFLTSGHVQAGLETLQSVLNTVGTRLPSARYALLLLVYRRILVWLRGLGFRPRAVDPGPRGAAGQDRHFLVGEHWPEHDRPPARRRFSSALPAALAPRRRALSARSLALPRGCTRGGLGRRGRAPSQTLARQGRELARPLNNPYLTALQSLVSGTCAYFCGHWHAAIEHCRDAETTFRDHCTGVTWELDTAIGFGLSARSFAGDVRELAERLPFVLAEAGKRGDVYATGNNGTITLPALAADDPDRAARTLSQWHREDFQVQRFDELVAHVEIDLYRNRGAAAWDRVHGDWSGLAKSFLFHIQFLRSVASFARARSALAAARCLANPAPLLRVAERDARRLAGEGQPWTTPLAEIIRAGVDSCRGRSGRACQRLRNAARLFDAADMPLYAMAATRRLGELLGGEEGRRLLNQADAAMNSRGVRDPVRMTAVYAPGFPASATQSQVAAEQNVQKEGRSEQP